MDSLDWKEAQSYSDSGSDEEEVDYYEKEAVKQAETEEPEEELADDNNIPLSQVDQFSQPLRDNKTFLYQRINLCLRRNITALSDPNQHKPKPNYASDSVPFDSWIENAIITISPNADLLLMAAQIPEKVTYIARLRMDPINQYTIKPLSIPLDFNEHVTSLLCLPIMSKQRTALGHVDWTALVIGLSSGYVKFYTEQNLCLLSLKYCDESIVSIKCQSQKINSNGRSETHFPSLIDELLITSKTSLVVIDGLCLYENLRLAKEEVIKNGSNYEPAYNLSNLPSILYCQKWRLDVSRESCITDAELLGTRRTTAFDSLKSDSTNIEQIPAKACARTIAISGRNPFISCYRESNDTSAHSYTEIIGSIFSLWNKPQPSKTQLVEVSNYNNLSFYDKDRLATSIISSPDKRLAAVTDDFGRVLLVDTSNWVIIRMWKGYRSAQCGWIEVKRNVEKRGCPHATFLVIYAPKRGLLEIWSSQRGPRVASFNVGRHCRLLYSGYKMLNMRSDKAGSVNHLIEQSYSSHCYLLNAKSENIFLIELPYTYSLYKYGNLKSRDHLLIGELSTALQHDQEVELISEIIHRIALTESLETSVHKVVQSSNPSKIIPIMENLINKIMKNYDNHSGETMTNDDLSIIELCKRIIRLCAIFEELSNLQPHDISIPDVNQRLIDQYEEHPKEIDEFANRLGWSTTEVLRYLSLLALDRSYRKNYLSNPWPSMGEPLAWVEFINCFDLSKINTKGRNLKNKDFNKVSIKLKEAKKDPIDQDKVIKTAIFMYNRMSETFYKNIENSKYQQSDKVTSVIYNNLEPSSRLVILFQFWLSTKLCNHWKMWSFLQEQVGQISDELKVIAMDKNDDSVLIDTWKRIYNLILESDNIFAAIISTAAIKSDTLRMIQDNEKREKLEAVSDKGNRDSQEKASVDWECLCIDAERLSLLSQQLEDVFLLNLLLKYSISAGHLIDSYSYRVPRISVANILRGGPTIVSELVAQWAVQANANLDIFTKPYGTILDSEHAVLNLPSTFQESSKSSTNVPRLYSTNLANLDNEEHAKELLHHTKTSFPYSLEPDVILLHSIWSLGQTWATNRNSTSFNDKTTFLKRIYEGMTLIQNIELRHKLISAAYKTFFQRTLERLIILVESNSAIVNVRSSKLRDSLARKELNMGEECLDDFVQFCCDLSEFMLQTSSVKESGTETKPNPFNEDFEFNKRLLRFDNWWSTSGAFKMLDETKQKHNRRRSSNIATDESNSSGYLIQTILSTSNLLSVDVLVELNKLTNLLNLIFKLKITKPFPMTLIGEESRQILQLDLHQSPTGGGGIKANLKDRTGSLVELRNKFARKCILNIACKLTEESPQFNEDEAEEDDQDQRKDIDIDQHKSPFIVDKAIQKQTKLQKKSMFATTRSTSNSGKTSDANDDDDDDESMFMRDENNESMVLFANLLSLANDWQLSRDELHLELVFELYRCNHDKMAAQLSNRVIDQQTLSTGLLKISSQRVLVLFGLSPYVSGASWKTRSDTWSIFQPNVSSWLKSIQQEEIKREFACLSFSDSLRIVANREHDRAADVYDDDNIGYVFGVQSFVLHALKRRTKVILERITNHLDGQAGRLAYDLLKLLDSHLFDKFILAGQQQQR